MSIVVANIRNFAFKTKINVLFFLFACSRCEGLPERLGRSGCGDVDFQFAHRVLKADAVALKRNATPGIATPGAIF